MSSYRTRGMNLTEKLNQTQNIWDFLFFKKPYHNKGKYFVLMCFVAILNACTLGVPLTKEKKASIRSVSISSDIQIPEAIDFSFEDRTPTKDNLEMILKAADRATKVSSFERRYALSGTSIDFILKEQFENELKKSNLFSSVVSSGGDAEFQFKIIKYGFDENLLDNKMQPVLSIDATLVTPNNTIIWNYKIFCCDFYPLVQSYSQSELYDDPDLMKQSLNEAAKAASIGLIEDMKKDSEHE